MENKQLFEKRANEYNPFFPIVRLEDIIDTISDKSIQWILNNYNHIYVEYSESKAITRNKVPVLLRRKGLWVSYNIGKEVITEYYVGDNNDITNYKEWTADINWKKFNEADILDGSITYKHLSESLKQLIGEGNTITNFPDEEDITSTDNILSFKDRNYEPDKFSGLGKVILRKNIIVIDGQPKNILTQEMINKENTIYEIRYDFDLNGEEITIPEGCVLDFQGGKLNNGVVFGNNTIFNISNIKVFTDIKFKGTFYYKVFNLSWIAEEGDDISYCIDNIIECFDTILYDRNYILSKTLDLKWTSNKTIKGNLTTRPILNYIGNDVVIDCGLNTNIENIYIDVINSTFSGVAIRLFANYLNRVYVRIDNVYIHFTHDSDIIDAATPISIGVQLKSDGTGSGIYNTQINDVVVDRAVIAFDFDAGNDKDTSKLCWINTNYIKRCKANGCITSLKMRAHGNANSQIIGNEVHITTQNFAQNKHIGDIYDIDNYRNIKENIIEGYAWDYKEIPSELGDSGGSSLGNIGNNYQYYNYKRPYNDKNWVNLIGTFSNLSGGQRFVEIDMYWYYGVPVTYYFYTDGREVKCKYKTSIDLDNSVYNSSYKFYYYENNNIIYLYSYNSENYFWPVIKINSSYGFTLASGSINARYEDVKDKLTEISIDSIIKLASLTDETKLLYNSQFDGKKACIIATHVSSFEDMIADSEKLGAANGRVSIYRCNLKDLGYEGEYGEFCTVYLTLSGYAYSSEHKNYGSHAIAVSHNGIVFTNFCLGGERGWRGWICIGGYQPSGKTANRPSYANSKYFDTELLKEIIYVNGRYYDTDGEFSETPRVGTFAERPIPNKTGFRYFCTDRQTAEGATDGIMIYHKGENVWVDALGRVVE